MEENCHPPKTVHDLLEEHFPLHRYSQEDRLNALLFVLRVEGLVDVLLKDLLKEEKNYPVGIVHDLFNGRTEALRSQVRQGRGRTLLEALFFTDGKKKTPEQKKERQNEPKPELRIVFESEFTRLRNDIGRRTHIGTDELHERGYRLMGRRAQLSVHELSDPRKVNSFPELVQALQALHRTQGSPSLREMAAGSEQHFRGKYRSMHQTRSHAALRRVTLPGAKPTLAAVLAFVRGCNVLGSDEAQEWIQAHARAATFTEE
ncbi:hypothetical protein [Nocardiopsis synnemataformans]|uniref:hypothetical protein n=1 Tax=Nocardiopsis synnemataformans TaxID=61305 RepID=UPI003EB7417C